MTMASVIALPRIVADVTANGFPSDKSSRVTDAAEKYADPRFKPSTLEADPENSYPGLRLVAKGVTLSELVGQPHAWWSNSWRSMLGAYGYMDVWTPLKLYWLLAVGWIGVGVSLAIWGTARRDRFAFFAVVCVGASLVVLSSLMHSWINDFQPQGRYLLPAVAIMAMFIASQPGLLRTRLFALSIVICYLGSLLSFIGVALPALAVR